ncbi:single-stranded DNA-binding protein [Patescibacteria group bacterium]|nr:single-stranded DNA-binding protein [Patescibacteria group bacterium]MBU1123578.1 single-stranded DNA-binding protein [Patescibacteria group bacterium]
MFSYNRVQIIGYQTQPVTLRQTPNGSSVTDLNLVVPYKFKSDTGEMLSGRSFHAVTLWGPMADIASQYIRPGSQIFISGRLQTDTWEDEQSEEKRSKTKIIALDMIMLDPKDGQIKAPAGAKSILNCVNRADIVGNLTRDPELRTTTNGKKVLTLGVATNERWKDKNSGEYNERVEFHNVVIWGDQAEEINSTLKKGNRVFVNGRVQTRGWETPSGAKRTTTEIIADEFLLLGVENAVAQESVQAEAARSESGSAPAPTAKPKSSKISDESEPVTVPEVKYSSEIKAEDLPF